MKFRTKEELLTALETHDIIKIESPKRRLKVKQTFIADTTNSLMLVSICNFFIVASCRVCGSNIVITDNLGFEHTYTDKQCEQLPIIILGKIID